MQRRWPRKRYRLVGRPKRLRLGPSWPRLLHGGVVGFLTMQSQQSTSREIPSIEPIVIVNLIDTQRDGWYGFWQFNRVELETVSGQSVVVSPDERFQNVRARVKDPELLLQLKVKWPEIRALMSKITGYHRRRKLTNQPLNQIYWLSRRHVLGDSLERIAEDAICEVGTVSDTVKELRQVMRLRVQESVSGRSRERRLPRLVKKCD